ncbi:MAG: substrate-binding domain-containing protein [Candidatus Margulisbacteria bacterium]|nr:substrate-binding domain-containing protein [Candidatus Margulisiibacteriota bacterium]
MKKILLFVMLISVFGMMTLSLAEELKVGAGAAPAENVLKPIRAAFEKATGIKLTIIASGPKIALLDLDKGAVDAAAAGLTVQSWADVMKKEGVEVADMSVYTPFVIGKDKIKVIINKNNNIKALSKGQLKGIFTGTITNWKDVGGEDMPIIVVWGKLIQGTNSLFIKNMMDGAEQLKDVLEVATADDIKKNVALTPEAIGIGPMTVADETVNSPETPEISRPITLMIKGKPSASVQKLLDFIKGEGQKYILK